MVVLLWSALAVGGSTPARACSCAATDPVDALREADAAFVGTLVRKDGPTITGGGFNTGQDVGYHFRVERVLKGDLPAAVTVRAALDGASCGLEFHGDLRTGLLLTADDGRWRSSLCRQVDADRLLAVAGGTSHAPPPDEAPATHPGSVALVLGLAGSLALVARRSVRRSG